MWRISPPEPTRCGCGAVSAERRRTCAVSPADADATDAGRPMLRRSRAQATKTVNCRADVVIRRQRTVRRGPPRLCRWASGWWTARRRNRRRRRRMVWYCLRNG